MYCLKLKTRKEGKKPSAPRLFRYTHTKGHDDQTFVDQRSRAANVSFIKIKLLLFFFFEDKLKYLFLLIFIRM